MVGLLLFLWPVWPLTAFCTTYALWDSMLWLYDICCLRKLTGSLVFLCSCLIRYLSTTVFKAPSSPELTVSFEFGSSLGLFGVFSFVLVPTYFMISSG